MHIIHLVKIALEVIYNSMEFWHGINFYESMAQGLDNINTSLCYQYITRGVNKHKYKFAMRSNSIKKFVEVL